MSVTLEGIEAQIRSYNPSADLRGIEEAYDFALTHHAGQMRKTGEPFISHPLEVAMILAGLNLDTATLQAAILHDVVEDSAASIKEVRELFGEEVAALVDGVTKLGRIKFSSLAEAQANNMRKMLIAMAKDIRVILIKLADRLHNMRTLAALPDEKRHRKAIETMEIYAPLAHRLGISSIKWELEDLAFFYLEPRKFAQIEKMVSESRDAREAYLHQVIDQLTTELTAIGVESEISGRPKHLYSIYQKMTYRGKDFSEIYDLIALRVIVGSVKDVYGALGTVHSIWKPVPGRFKDYVAMPKFNMYQSLHTTVIGPAGRPLEIQIRTEEMHRTAEYGIAAHWRYKEGGRADEAFDERLSWLRQMLEWQTELKDPREFMEALKIDLFEDEVFVFTPKGDVVSLRRGSTPIDFAYMIHTEVGHHCVGAKVNGSIVTLDYELQMGDRVDILTNKSSWPSRDWLNVVRTSSARSKIRSYFSKASREDDLVKGKDELGKILRKQGMHAGANTLGKALDVVAREMNLTEGDDLLAAIGSGKQSPKQVVTKLIKVLAKDEAAAPQPEPEAVLPVLQPSRAVSRRRSATGVRVKGIDDVLVRLANCCTPVPGDSIIGFVTRGRGVSVHRSDCANASSLTAEQATRMIEVEWDRDERPGRTFVAGVEVVALDRSRLLRDVTNALADHHVNILSCQTVTGSDRVAKMRFEFEFANPSYLDAVIRTIKGVDSVYDAYRLIPGAATPVA